MPFEIINWNIAENRNWWVRTEVASGQILVRVYPTLGGATGADGTFVGSKLVAVGSNREVILDVVASALSLFQESLPWHLCVSGLLTDPARVVKIGKFTDLPEIRDAIYTSAPLVASRATAEINQHTHVVLSRRIDVGVHYPSLNAGDRIKLSSTRRNKTETGQLVESVIEYRMSSSEDGEVSLTESMIVERYLAMRRS